MCNTEVNLLNSAIRSSFSTFIGKVFNTINPGIEYQHNWHIELISEYLEAVRKGYIKRLIINIPPRGLKSVCVSVAWPAWILGKDPSKRIMAASYSHTLSVKHSLDCRLVLTSDWYKDVFPSTVLSKKHNQKSKFLTNKNGFRFATSVGGSATGEGGDFLIVDDPHNPIQINSSKIRNKVTDWFDQTFLTRLNDKNKGAVVLVMQRLHEEDLSGYLLGNNTGWEHLKIPIQASHDMVFLKPNSKKSKSDTYQFMKGEIIHSMRDGVEDLVRLEKEVGTRNYAAQYLQEPIANECSLLKLEDISFYDDIPDTFDYFIQSWDTAIKTSENSDYSVATSFGISGKKYYLVSMMRSKLAYPDLKIKVEQLAKRYEPRFILIEDKASGQQLIQDLRLDGFTNIIALRPKLDKITRFASVVALFQAGILVLPRKSTFNSILLKEITTFPNSKNDDIIDSISQFLNYSKEISAKSKVRVRGF